MEYFASNLREEDLFTHLLYLSYQFIISDKESLVAVVALRPHGNRIVRQCCSHGTDRKQRMQSGTGDGDHLQRPVPCDTLLKTPQASKSNHKLELGVQNISL